MHGSATPTSPESWLGIKVLGPHLLGQELWGWAQRSTVEQAPKVIPLCAELETHWSNTARHNLSPTPPESERIQEKKPTGCHVQNVFPLLKNRFREITWFWKKDGNYLWLFVINSKRVEKRRDILKHEFILRLFLNTHKLVLFLQLYPGAEGNLKLSYI